ncbi:hypothetical protein HZA71_01540 [Candidatus Falkowbacteria bacterium]|nr:hypothetical protein [Candidatus Falkowbacteria bacterium]
MLKRHSLAIIFALLVGFFYVMPQLAFQVSLGDKFQGVYRVVNDDELYYMARAREVVDGHYFISNPYFAEYKNGLPMQVFLPDLISAMPAKVLNIRIYPLYEFYDFLLPALLFFLTYLIFYVLIKDRFWSLFLSGWIFLIKYFFMFNRPISPQFVFIFAVTLILLLIKIIKNSEAKNNLLIFLAAVNFGFLFHIYPYLWTYFSTVLVLLIIYYLWQKNFYLFKKFLIIFISGIIIGLPYFYQTWRAGKAEFFQDTMARLGMIYTRFPSGIWIVIPSLILLALLVYLYLKNRQNPSSYDLKAFFTVAILSAIINVNQHIITGKNFFFSSHYEIIAYLLVVFALAYILWSSEKIAFLMKMRFIKVLALIIIIVNFIPIFNKIYDFDFNEAVKIQQWQLAFDWLNRNTKKDEVVMANDEISNYLPSYTHNNVLFNVNGKLFFMSTEEILDRFALNNFWQKDFSNDFVKLKILSVYGYRNKALAGRAKQKNKIAKIFNFPQKPLDDLYYPPEQIKTILDYFKNIKEADWLNGLKKYQVKFLVLDNNQDGLLLKNISKYGFMQSVFLNNNVSIYKVNNF